jgi:hypothetical protein
MRGNLFKLKPFVGFRAASIVSLLYRLPDTRCAYQKGDLSRAPCRPSFEFAWKSQRTAVMRMLHRAARWPLWVSLATD